LGYIKYSHAFCNFLEVLILIRGIVLNFFSNDSRCVNNILSLAVPCPLLLGHGWVSRAGTQRLDFVPARPLCWPHGTSLWGSFFINLSSALALTHTHTHTHSEDIPKNTQVLTHFRHSTFQSERRVTETRPNASLRTRSCSCWVMNTLQAITSSQWRICLSSKYTVIYIYIYS